MGFLGTANSWRESCFCLFFLQMAWFCLLPPAQVYTMHWDSYIQAAGMRINSPKSSPLLSWKAQTSLTSTSSGGSLRHFWASRGLYQGFNSFSHDSNFMIMLLLVVRMFNGRLSLPTMDRCIFCFMTVAAPIHLSVSCSIQPSLTGAQDTWGRNCRWTTREYKDIKRPIFFLWGPGFQMF